MPVMQNRRRRGCPTETGLHGWVISNQPPPVKPALGPRGARELGRECPGSEAELLPEVLGVLLRCQGAVSQHRGHHGCSAGFARGVAVAVHAFLLAPGRFPAAAGGGGGAGLSGGCCVIFCLILCLFFV